MGGEVERQAGVDGRNAFARIPQEFANSALGRCFDCVSIISVNFKNIYPLHFVGLKAIAYPEDQE